MTSDRSGLSEMDSAVLQALFLINGGTVTTLKSGRHTKAMNASQRQFARGNSKSGAFRYPRPC